MNSNIDKTGLSELSLKQRNCNWHVLKIKYL